MRILPLSEERQGELIDNSFLEPKQKAIVSQHMASSSSSLMDNPLFLTLLCRYVKDHNAPPVNDHDLLSGHIDRLARRDEDYILRKYGLTHDQLIEGAIQLAILFAVRRTLSLAPTQTEIAAELPDNSVPGRSLENMLSTLVDVKIGRSDVQDARAGDRRFTFFHRRYQETLFVRYLVANINYVSPRELLTDTRWREYSVTLLQTQQLEVIEPLLTESTSLVAQYAMSAVRVQIMQEFGGHLAYYDWQTDPAVPLLIILQEGLARRLSDVPPNLSIQIEQLLGCRWKDGDAYDQSMVLKHGGLLPQPVLEEYLAYAVNKGDEDMGDVAFQRVVFLKDIPPTLSDWVRDRLSTDALQVLKQADVLRLEALSARLPYSVGSMFVLWRCQLIKNLRWPFEQLYRLFLLLPHFLLKLLGGKYSLYLARTLTELNLARLITEVFFPLYVVVLSLVFTTSVPSLIEPIHSEFELNSLWLPHVNSLLSKHIYLYGGLGLVYVGVAAALLTLYTQRSIGCRLSMPYALRRIHEASRRTLREKGFVKKAISNVATLLKLGFISLIPIFFLVPIVSGVGMLFGYRNFDALATFSLAYIVALVGSFVVGAVAGVVSAHYNNRRFLSNLRTLKSQGWVHR